ncbi:Excreted virulence factor EspC, type VII ESX diderm [Actinopolyspora xinjiangensis]|uniref:Excreted virulence factor EspC, type VII ESX diderm n=1 Tax=Actinopolyspora xinjiangensis TaxID=405564 RepID=A0A1H0VPZ2_9ACTN|nr:type VII secretion target [Actinopolyspora xinjiangensis]SDP80662.1 Excreted virulence factor EspC, type VII ESX diderm [Actinopolyspora xinjiangensis]
MAHTGKEFGTDLYGLKQVANSDLPTVSAAYDSAVDKCASARDGVSGISGVPEQFVAEGGAVADKYQRAHDSVIGLLRKTRENLDETAEALNQAAEQYAEDDRAAAARLQQLLDDRGTPKPE